MKDFAYYSFRDEESDGLNLNSRESEERPIILNCAGSINLSNPFTTHNRKGRADYYLMYIVEGKLRVYFEDRTVTVGSGDFLLFPPEYKYKYSLTSGSVAYYYAHFTGSYVESFLGRLGFVNLPAAFSAESSSVLSGFSEIFDICSGAVPKAELYLGAALEKILIDLSCNILSEEGRRCRLNKSLTYINSSLSESISVSDLAAIEGLSPSRYTALFRELMGQAPMQYVLSLRIKQAKSLLSLTDLPVKKIAELCGYRDNHFFSKAFSCAVGVSPIQYRREYR